MDLPHHHPRRAQPPSARMSGRRPHAHTDLIQGVLLVALMLGGTRSAQVIFHSGRGTRLPLLLRERRGKVSAEQLVALGEPAGWLPVTRLGHRLAEK